MARLSLAPLLCALALALAGTVRAIAPNELTFAAIAAQNATKQWTLSMARGHESSPADFKPINCTNPAHGACVADIGPPIMQDTGDLLRVAYDLTNPRGANGALKTFGDAAPTKIELRACFALATSVDRAWRKKNKPYPRLSQNCPRLLFSGPFNGPAAPVDAAANSGAAVKNFNDFDELPTATWFVSMWVYCGESVCAFESTEGAPANATAVPPKPAVPGNFFETQVEMGITPAMRASAIILAIFGPAFFAAFWLADNWHYKKKGTPILLF